MDDVLLESVASPTRLRWLFTEYPIDYLTACSYRRQPILARPDVHDSFIQFGLRATEYGVTVGRMRGNYPRCTAERRRAVIDRAYKLAVLWS
jgi:hypothetical protein